MNWNRLVLPAMFFAVMAYLFGWLWAAFAINAYGPIANANGFGDEPRLPGWLSYFQTPDNSLLGDGAWQRCEPAHWAWRSWFAWFPLLYRYLGRVGWIMRNPAQGYDRTICARLDIDCDFKFEGDPAIRDKPAYKAGKLSIVASNPDGSTYWAEYRVSRPLFGFCWVSKRGWDLRTYIEDPRRLATQPTAKFMCTARPSGISI